MFESEENKELLESLLGKSKSGDKKDGHFFNSQFNFIYLFIFLFF